MGLAVESEAVVGTIACCTIVHDAVVGGTIASATVEGVLLRGHFCGWHCCRLLQVMLYSYRCSGRKCCSTGL